MAPEKCLKPHVHTGPTVLNVGVPVTPGCVSGPTGLAMKQSHFLLVLWAAHKVSVAAECAHLQSPVSADVYV